jgi:LPXTG-motif cell wall-anchored protein
MGYVGFDTNTLDVGLGYYGGLSGITAPTRDQQTTAASARHAIFAALNAQAAWAPLSLSVGQDVYPMASSVVDFWMQIAGQSPSWWKAYPIMFGKGTKTPYPTPDAKSRTTWTTGDITWMSWIEPNLNKRALIVIGYNPVTLPAAVAGGVAKWVAATAGAAAKTVADTTSTVTRTVSRTVAPVVDTVAKTFTAAVMAPVVMATSLTQPSTKPASTKPSLSPSSTDFVDVSTYAVEQKSWTAYWLYAAGALALGGGAWWFLKKKKRG